MSVLGGTSTRTSIYGFLSVLFAAVMVVFIVGSASSTRAETPQPSVLIYGSPITLTVANWALNDGAVRSQGACFTTPVPAADGGARREVIVTATAGGQTCSVRIVDRSDAVIEEVTMQTALGEQRLQLAKGSGRVPLGTARMLAPRGQRTMQGMPVTFFAKSKVCTVSRARGQWILMATARGTCRVSARAQGIDDRYTPLTQILTFQVRPRR